MPVNLLRWTCGAAGVVCGTALLLALAYAQPTPPPKQPQGGNGQAAGPDLTKAKYFGARSCSACHQKPNEIAYPNPSCRLTEFHVWFTEDKHALAFKVLKGPLGKEIGQRLRLDPTTSYACLNCHAMNFPEERRDMEFTLEDGVTCDGCHGPSEHWYTPHSRAGIWRRKSPEEKAQLGFLDVRDPRKRARLCVACHIGSAQEGKVVTHEMYAAGHPPLPGVEVATFSESMPRHWEPLAKKKPAIQKLFDFDMADAEQAKVVAVGGLVSLAESMKLVADQIEGKGKGNELGVTWPELAAFDCFACHHELRSDNWRQRRGFPGTPGRPTKAAWTEALATLAGHWVENDEASAHVQLQDFRTRLRSVNEAFTAQPFGDPKALASAARSLAAWADAILARLPRTKRLTRPMAERLLQDLGRVAQANEPDFDSARQLAWAFQRIYDQLKDPIPAKDKEIQELFHRLTKMLCLDLPYGQGRSIVKELPRRYEAMQQYDPRQFQREFARLAALLPP